jgi:hypothetical protein
MCTAKAAQLKAHVESKHSLPADLAKCFPAIGQMEADEAAAASAAAASPALPKKDAVRSARFGEKIKK